MIRNLMPPVLAMILAVCSMGFEIQAQEVPPLLVHSTDLFRPHDDPDDHWDLACVYALHARGRVDLRLVLANAPRLPEKMRSPDVMAVAQMNRITGAAVPVIMGTTRPMKAVDDAQSDAPRMDRYGVDRLLDVLRRADRPVTITVTGSCRDVAVAAARNPDLFAKKCEAVYINAGTGSPDPERAKHVEFNARWDRVAYTAMFTLPCPVYWLPCFELDEGPLHKRPVRTYGTHYRFLQSRILSGLSAPVKRYFVHMFEKVEDPDWAGYIDHAEVNELVIEHGKAKRYMWSTATFFHVAGLGVKPDGALEPVGKGEASSSVAGAGVFAFRPIRVTCEDAVTRWKADDASTDRFIFTVTDLEHYEEAMTRAMCGLLLGL